MRIIVASTLAAAALALGAGVLLFAAQKPAYHAATMPTVRIGDPGDNLVGPDWSGVATFEAGIRVAKRADAK
jgi:hypothetical protein